MRFSHDLETKHEFVLLTAKHPQQADDNYTMASRSLTLLLASFLASSTAFFHVGIFPRR